MALKGCSMSRSKMAELLEWIDVGDDGMLPLAEGERAPDGLTGERTCMDGGWMLALVVDGSRTWMDGLLGGLVLPVVDAAIDGSGISRGRVGS